MDRDLLQGCVDGDRKAQKQLYEKCYSKMMSACMRYASDTDEAMEILNMGFFKVFTTIGRYQNEINNLEGWIYRIIVNTAIDHFRKEFKHKRTVETDHALSSQTAYDVVSDLSAEEILKLVQQLSPAYRTVFNLYVMEGFTHREIAEKLKVTEGTSKSNLAKARAKLQKMIREQDRIKLKAYAG